MVLGDIFLSSFKVGKKAYVHHEFPQGFNAIGLRVTSDTDGVVERHIYISII